jgi:hypothetical protein
MPWRMAPAWPDTPPPVTVASTSNLSTVPVADQRLTDDELQGLKSKIVVDAAAVDGDGAGAAGEQVNAGDGGLSAAGAVQYRVS